MSLERELATYQKNLPDFKSNEGKFVLIVGDKIIDFFATYQDAIKEGYQQFGVDRPFLVKQIRAIEQVQFISRFIAPNPISAGAHR